MDLSVLAAESGMSVGEAFSISSTGMIVVLIVLIVLAVLVLLISKGVRAAQGKGQQSEEEATAAPTAPVSVAQSAAPAPAAPVVNGTPLPENQSAGQLELYDCDEKSAAVIMAIISNESGIPLNHLEFKSIKAIEE
ncbi:MAG TPA: OadG family protein [Candidatus Fimenecus stercoravium]|nr:OadG family protein [Candidatus Fimenecus stercoravium]